MRIRPESISRQSMREREIIERRTGEQRRRRKRRGRTFDPGKSEIFWCDSCNVPLLSMHCSVCGSIGRRIYLSPPADVRLCSSTGRDLLRDLFARDYGYDEFLDRRIILLNKIAGIDRRDQVYLDGRHIATLWFDITTQAFRLDLELAGAALLADHATRNLVVCSETLQKGHLKGKWIEREFIQELPKDLIEGESIILRVGRYMGVGIVRKRSDGSTAIRIKDVTGEQLGLNNCVGSIEDVIAANVAHLKRLENDALKELKEALRREELPVNISFSGGKDSLAALCLGLKVKPSADVVFIDTGLEFPDTVEYVNRLAKSLNLKLHIIAGKDEFFGLAENFGPPAKDFRWCCKTNKLGPLTAFIEQHYSGGCLTIEGRRIYESFSRSKIGAVEKNPYVPNQITLCPIRNWNALEVMLYIFWNKLEPNPLYERDYERIGCWLCPASLQSEFANTKKTHPDLHGQWTSYLEGWARDCGLDSRFVDWGLWRWKSHPPKIVEIAKANNISLKIEPRDKPRIALDMVKGQSPCGVNYSIEANLIVPKSHPFSAVANVLNMLGSVKYSESLGTAILETEDGRCTIFANGHLLVVAPKEKANDLLRDVVETILRLQMCTGCKICERSCKRGAISVKESIVVDEKKCNRCKRCLQGCIAVAEASKTFRNLTKDLYLHNRLQMPKNLG